MIALPNHTQVPNDLMDEWMKEWSGSHLKIFLAVCRKTIGWHKVCDGISYSQLMAMTGLATEACSEALKWLSDKGFIIIHREQGKTSKIEIAFNTSSKSEDVPLRNSKSTSSKSEDTKETTKIKEEPPALKSGAASPGKEKTSENVPASSALSTLKPISLCPSCGADAQTDYEYDYFICEACRKPWPGGVNARKYFDNLPQKG
jgi:phage replication O-like protein O